ncbi:MAG TPA: NAD(+) synthase [Candidatus Acetatifactor stercoripullorum]|uniref:Glutamine-dependent NAD(+) synthetase n=1 Tax=Candidatus Acetatifactor stercoripullorum TaxID=2838414 RepID=A0A9D1R738_9FIRM|nr:NAD(+) synthase [uncultured Acetatifactor sp.]HIW82100.1 NAD(+) synthase [Candidatus Acetatifactor stercoripullorum]
MQQGFIKTAAVTPKIRVADPAYNAQVILEKLEEAWEHGARIIVFPELCLTGYTCGDLFLQQKLLEEAKRQLLLIANATEGKDALVMVGLPLERDGRLYNVAAVLQDGAILGMVPKSNIPSYAEFYEGRHFSQGNAQVVSYYLEGEEIPFGTNLLFECMNLPGLTLGCEICEDLWVASPPGTNHGLMGASVIVNLSASNETVGKGEYRELLVRSASARLICGYIYASAGEGESTQDLVFGGHNLIAENGVILAQSKRFTGETVYGDLDLQRIAAERRRMGTFGKEPDLSYVAVPFKLNIMETKLERSFERMPFVPKDQAARNKRCEEILSIQAFGLKKRYEHTGLKTAVIGVSGGLDSTLALLITVRTFDMLGLDRRGITAVTMPCFGTTDRTYENACRLAKTLNTTLREVDIRDAVLIHFRDIGQDQKNHDITYENGQARERTQVLMDIANQQNGLVIGTGDMSELALGWATYNGDHMSMYGVNAGVPKTLVRHLVKYYADTCGDEALAAVLLDVLDTPVSPELLPPVDGVISQKTEDLVGPYELHDFFLYYMLRCGFPPAKVYRVAKKAFQGSYDNETILKWLKTFYRRFFGQQFKRSCLPDGPKVGSVALSPRGDLRMPSDASAQIWLKELEGLL